MEKFVGKLAVVTGAKHGIGKAITVELLKKGVNVAGLGRDIAALKDFGEEVSANPKIYSGKFYAFQCDVTQPTEIESTFEKMKTTIGPIWIMVNNAGLVHEALLMEVTAKNYDDNFDVHTKGLMLCGKEAVNSMVESSVEGGHVINIICVTDRVMTINYPTYRLFIASKIAARELSESLRREIVKHKLNIKLTTIDPGVVTTAVSSSILGALPPMETIAPEDFASGIMAILNTPPNVMITNATIGPTHDVFIV